MFVMKMNKGVNNILNPTANDLSKGSRGEACTFAVQNHDRIRISCRVTGNYTYHQE